MSPEVMLQQFLNIFGIPKHEYANDLMNFEEKIATMRHMLKTRVIHGVDTYPYMYILHKLECLHPQTLYNFLLYFSVMMKRNDICVVTPDIEAVLNKCDNSIIFIYFMAVLQYYLL